MTRKISPYQAKYMFDAGFSAAIKMMVDQMPPSPAKAQEVADAFNELLASVYLHNHPITPKTADLNEEMEEAFRQEFEHLLENTQ